jgi:hypothetical protein
MSLERFQFTFWYMANSSHLFYLINVTQQQAYQIYSFIYLILHSSQVHTYLLNISLKQAQFIYSLGQKSFKRS